MGRIHGKQGEGRALKPLARADDLVVEELADELLVYDLKTDDAHCLSATAARVWRACDGDTTVATLESDLGLDADAVAKAVEDLERCSLLQAPAGLTRRELNIKVTKAGVAAASIPFIVSIGVPAVAAATPTVAQCRSGFTQGCGSCTLAGCCCCGPAGGPGAPPATKDCVPTGQCGVVAFPLAPVGSKCSVTN